MLARMKAWEPPATITLRDPAVRKYEERIARRHGWTPEELATWNRYRSPKS